MKYVLLRTGNKGPSFPIARVMKESCDHIHLLVKDIQLDKYFWYYLWRLEMIALLGLQLGFCCFLCEWDS
jgi:hypothetical protein